MARKLSSATWKMRGRMKLSSDCGVVRGVDQAPTHDELGQVVLQRSAGEQEPPRHGELLRVRQPTARER